MIRALIVEDELKSVEVIKGLIKNNSWAKIEVVGVVDSNEDAYNAIMKLSPDLIFLDIELRDGSSFNMLKKIENPNFKIIFTTAFDKFAIRAFKFSAVDYLLKPLDDQEFEDALTKYVKQYGANLEKEQIKNIQSIYESNQDLYKNKLAIKDSKGVVFEPLSNIIALVAEKSYTMIVLINNKKNLSTKNLGFYEEILDDTSQFFRSHHSCIVNLEQIKSFNISPNSKTAELTMNNNQSFPVSSRRIADLKKILNLK